MWFMDLFTTSAKIDEAMAFNDVIDHALLQKYKAIYTYKEMLNSLWKL